MVSNFVTSKLRNIHHTFH